MFFLVLTFRFSKLLSSLRPVHRAELTVCFKGTAVGDSIGYHLQRVETEIDDGDLRCTSPCESKDTGQEDAYLSLLMILGLRSHRSSPVILGVKEITEMRASPDFFSRIFASGPAPMASAMNEERNGSWPKRRMEESRLSLESFFARSFQLASGSSSAHSSSSTPNVFPAISAVYFDLFSGLEAILSNLRPTPSSLLHTSTTSLMASEIKGRSALNPPIGIVLPPSPCLRMKMFAQNFPLDSSY